MGNSPAKDEKNMFSFGDNNPTLCGDLTYKTRIIGFLACSITGWLLSLIITFVFIFSQFNIATYAILYSLGQVLNIAGSCFCQHLRSDKSNEEEAQIDSILSICWIDNINIGDCNSYGYKRTGIVFGSIASICLLLVYDKFHTIWE